MERPTICLVCKKSSQEVKILDAVKEARPVKICEFCARIEDVILIRKPSSRQLSDPNSSMSVYNRLRRLSGIDDDEASTIVKNTPQNYSQSDFSRGSDFGEYSIKKRKEMMEKLNKPANLVDHANWIIQKERRNRRLTMKQLADAIGVGESVIKMVEEGKLPDDGRRVMEKIEQYFHIKLIKDELRSPGFNKNVVYRSASDYEYTKPNYSKNDEHPISKLSAEVLVEKIPSEIPKSMPTREERNYKSPLQTRPLPTTKLAIQQSETEQKMNHGIPLSAGATSGRITNKSQMSAQTSRGQQGSQLSVKKDSYGIPLNAGASSSRITNRPPMSLIADAAKTQELVNRPTLSNKPSYMVPNPSRVTGNPLNKPKFSLVDDAMKTSQEVPRVQNASKLQISSRNSSDVTLSQLQDIKKERDRLLDAKKEQEEANKEFKGEIEFVDLDEE